MRKCQIFSVSLFLLGLFQSGARAANEPIDRCVAAIGSIRSYDVTFRREVLDYIDLLDLKGTTNIPEVAFTQTNRDVFADGLGRRNEENIGTTNHDVGVLDLRTARPDLAMCNIYRAYPFYINPVVDAANGRSWSDCFFLTDLLTNKNSTFSPFETSPSDGKLVGFQVDNPPMLHGQYVRVWLDPEHDYMPQKVELYMRTESHHTSDGPIALTKRMQVDEFKQVEATIWVPTKGSSVLIAPAGEYKGRVLDGSKMEVDLEHSSWNSIKSDELFLAKSLPEVNYKKDGWVYDYSPGRLENAKVVDGAVAKIAQIDHNLKHPSKVIKWIVLGAMCAFTGVLILVLISSRKKSLV
jgi:hypothetical protein